MYIDIFSQNNMRNPSFLFEIKSFLATRTLID